MGNADQHIARVGQRIAIAVQQISIVDHLAGFVNQQTAFVSLHTGFVGQQKGFVGLQKGLYSGRLEVYPLIRVPEAVPRPGYGPANVRVGVEARHGLNNKQRFTRFDQCCGVPIFFVRTPTTKKN